MSALADLWRDDALRQSLLANPRPMLQRLGLQIPGDVEVKALGSRGKPSDPVATLLQIVLDRGPDFAFFFIPSPLQASAQQAAYGVILGTDIDDPVFDQRVQADAHAAFRALGIAASDPPGTGR